MESPFVGRRELRKQQTEKSETPAADFSAAGNRRKDASVTTRPCQI
jgi:hypothetical protein